jgi:hypothetical protein
MRYILFSLISISLTSCVGPLGNKNIRVNILNVSNSSISDVKITTSENLDSLFFSTIANNDKEIGTLNMQENKTDGHYQLSYKQGKKYHHVNRGYYTNGSALEYSINFIIKSDTVLVKF